MDLEGSPIPDRCDSTLSVIKIQPATRNKKGRLPVLTQRFSDPEIEELYQLHSTNRKRAELFPCFLYAILLYCASQIFINSIWIVNPENDSHPFAFPYSMHKRGEPSSTPPPLHYPSDAFQGIVEGDGYLNEKFFLGDRETKSILVSSARDTPYALPRLTRNKIGHPHGTSERKRDDDEDYESFTQNWIPTKNFRKKQRIAITWRNISTQWKQVGPNIPEVQQMPKPSHLKVSPLQQLQMSYHSDPLDRYKNGTDENSVLFSVVTFGAFAFTMIVTIFILISSGSCKGNPHIPVILWSATIALSLIMRNDYSIPLRLGLGWIILETFLIWVTLPLRLRSALLYSILLIVLHSGIVIWKSTDQHFFRYQLAVNLILLITTNLLGILAFYLSDKKQRRAFLDTRQSLEMKLVIEEQAKEQERLLLSVLPEHLALKIRQDLGAAGDSQFQTIYMSRHENVSILYADIVGFTAISSTYSASELVKILNELFARFDKLADKYHQLRIKILGDCYYCICGAPEERTDHAVLAVHMGLSMVKAIKYLQQTTNSPVDMRVGIHTGAILAGVLGQRQWQFDVYSKDVELANKMESSGMPGRVQVSDKTLNYLNNEFEVEPGFGEKREEILRIAGLKTYFIVRVLKPFSEQIPENGSSILRDDDEKEHPGENSTFAEDSVSAVEENGTAWKDTEKKQSRATLQDELTSRGGYKDLSRQSQWFTLRFHDAQKESQFVAHKEPNAGVASLACPCALIACAISSFFVISFNVLGLITSIVGIILLLSISVFSACETNLIKSRLKHVSALLISRVSAYESKLWVRRLLSIFTIFLLTITNAIFSVPCWEAGSQCSNFTLEEVSEHNMEMMPPMVLPIRLMFSSLGCRFPAYLILFCSLLLCSITMLSQPGFWIKSVAMFLVLALHAVLLILQPVRTAFDCSERFSFLGGIDLIPETWQLILYIIVIFLVLFTLNRRLEKSARVLFLWKSEMEQRRERAAQLRQKNEALVYNILPQHVASHFLGSRQRKHEELYSQSYSDVGILFASMPNFTDFYSEETVNNQGLECLRFLNEVISDFDNLLELPRFKDNIFKIKTISSTYMAASGLSPSKQVKPDSQLKIRWTHLSLLVEFAFELKRALTSINEQSFNHFVLKMGINHGPITAGVIGARKPHYDIWGNSVNVASRMESTGKAGCIQVTEETYKILLIFGYQFEQRGLVNVKGKGQLMTYYLVGRGPELTEQQVDDLLAKMVEQPSLTKD